MLTRWGHGFLPRPGQHRVNWRHALVGILCACSLLSGCGGNVKKIDPANPELLAKTATHLAELKREFEALKPPNGAGESDDTQVRDFCARGRNDSTGEDTGALQPQISRRWGGLDSAQRALASDDLRRQLLNTGWRVSDASMPLSSTLSKDFDGWTGVATISTTAGIDRAPDDDVRKGQLFLTGTVAGEEGCPPEQNSTP